MAYFARIDEHGTVLQVISVSNDNAPDPAPAHSEPLGQTFIAEVLGLPGEWRQTSFRGSIRRRYAGIGFRYDSDRDAFIAPQPWPSWTLNAEDDWEAPVPYPSDGNTYRWDEATLSWIEAPPV